MRLEMGTFPVHAITFGSQTRYQDGHLEVDKATVLEAVQTSVTGPTLFDPMDMSLEREVSHAS